MKTKDKDGKTSGVPITGGMKGSGSHKQTGGLKGSGGTSYAGAMGKK